MNKIFIYVQYLYLNYHPRKKLDSILNSTTNRSADRPIDKYFLLTRYSSIQKGTKSRLTYLYSNLQTQYISYGS